MIRAANSYPGIPLLGINFGNVGFLALIERQLRHDLNGAIEVTYAPAGLRATITLPPDVIAPGAPN